MEYLQYNIVREYSNDIALVLNLVINGIPSIQITKIKELRKYEVLNLVINGIPSILRNRS